MVNITDKTQCTGCTACASVCTHKAISMQFDEYGHSYPNVDASACTDCGLCEKVCPLLHNDCILYDQRIEQLPVYAIYNNDNEVRKQSTSGGVFTLLAEYVINKGGIVYAARFDEKYHILHDSFSSMDEIAPFRGSKYAQSDLNDTFRKIKTDLKNRDVLFVGTPCQVAGLKSYLIKDYENLYTCDFVCMGISSPVIWEEYLDAFWNRNTIKKIFFKDKRKGWHQWQMLVEDDEGEHLIKGIMDPFFNGYLTHRTYRPSCLKCSFRTCERVSDFTIADCWGIDKYKPEFDDNKGCTTIILQSEKAKGVFEDIKKKANVMPYPIEMVLEHNPYIRKKISSDQNREAFYKFRKFKGYKAAAIKYCIPKQPSFLKRVINIIKAHL